VLSDLEEELVAELQAAGFDREARQANTARTAYKDGRTKGECDTLDDGVALSPDETLKKRRLKQLLAEASALHRSGGRVIRSGRGKWR
jgi:hypothetical protein